MRRGAARRGASPRGARGQIDYLEFKEMFARGLKADAARAEAQVPRCPVPARAAIHFWMPEA